MDQKRTKTLEALEEFIQAQQSLLDTTYSDIELLREARTAALTDPPTFIDNIHTRLDAPSFRLSSLPDWQLIIPKGLDWSVFEGLDPAPLQKYTLDAQLAYHARHEPHTTQKSPLSDLQKLVKSARRSIIDPVLAAFAQAPEIKKDNNNGEEEESESEIDEEEIQREREREKIRQLKQRKIRTGGLRLPSRLRMEGSTAVFIRHDVEDESMDVDISMDHDGDDDDVHNNRTTATVPRPPELSRSSRVVPLSRTRQDQATPAAPRSRSYKKARKEVPPKAPLSPLPVPPPTPKPVESTQKSGKPKPETYKQAWSLSEQHLLEQLLEQIPEGEKYRWQKISRAMNGRRTPRQVASRVQKYFEKLKKYGIEG